MKKVIKLTEAELTNLIKKVIQEQSTEKSIKPAPSNQSVGKLISTMSKTK